MLFKVLLTKKLNFEDCTHKQSLSELVICKTLNGTNYVDVITVVFPGPFGLDVDDIADKHKCSTLSFILLLILSLFSDFGVDAAKFFVFAGILQLITQCSLSFGTCVILNLSENKSSRTHVN